MITLPQHDKLHFSYNWNQKLQCTAFTTIRLDNPKYAIGSLWAIHLKTKLYRPHLFEIVDKKTFLLDQINDYTAYIDTGYNALQCKEVIMKMYTKSFINWSIQPLCMPLLVKTDHEIIQNEQLTIQ